MVNQGVDIFTKVAVPWKGLHYKDITLIDDRHHLLNTPRNLQIVGPNVAVQYSRPYFSHPDVKEKNSGLATH